MPPPSPPPLLVLIIPTIAFFLWLIANPSFLSTTTHHRSNSIHRSWDSVNILLVIFAILCGVFARKNDDDSSDNASTSAGNSSSGLSYKEGEDDDVKRSVSNPPSWFDQFSNDGGAFGRPRLKRSSSSYPDLRQESWENLVDEDQRFRFFDDFDLTSRLYTSSPSSQYIHRPWNRTTLLSEQSNAKEISVDIFVLRSPPSPSPPPPPPPAPPPPPRKQVYRTIPRQEKLQQPAVKTPPPPPPPPPRPPPSPLPDKKYVKSDRKKSNATKEIKIILASLYNQRKRKKKQRNMKNNTNSTYDHVSPQTTSEHTSYFRPPPPPPPPPPPSKFYNLFHKRNHKSKKIHSFSAPPPPPPPPQRKLYLPPTTPPRKISTSTGKPPLPTRINSYYEENVNSGNQSPLIPPPPPPPFKVGGFRFVVSGDFVRIRSASSSRCGSPEREAIEEVTAETRGGNGGGASVFCPSPDVNVKADSFIARLRDEWRIEKMNSRKERALGTSPTPGPL